ncbi:MAG: hypothetical protein FWF00_01325 [Endomicrobia bacterium]|nr:hypothetical protein [Endomicrobiia bacterium]MCL2506316.1 hypothetical protein [Endomicrobiia bacterium]
MSLLEKIKSLFCCSGKCCGKKQEDDLKGDETVQKFEDDGAEILGADAEEREVTERPMKDGD